MSWIDVKVAMPFCEANTDGKPCVAVGKTGNVYRARYMHDVCDGIDRKYWSEFTVDFKGREVEHYEISEEILFWKFIPEMEISKK